MTPSPTPAQVAAAEAKPMSDLDHARYDRDGWMESALRARAELAAALARAERAEKAIGDYLDGNYDHPRAHRPDKCRHGIWYWETCENCIDEHFTAALAQPDTAEEK